MKISIQSFKGVSPRTNPRYLDDGGAQIALNVEAFGQSVKPLKGLGGQVTTLTKTGTMLTLYRFGQDETNESRYWFHWDKDVDVCRSQIAGDTAEWTFYTGDGSPRATNNTLALAGVSTAYPVASRRLGLPAPTSKKLMATVTNPVAKTDAATVTLTATAVGQMRSDYGVKVSTSTDKGETWTTNPVTLPTTAAPQVTLTTAHVAAVTPEYGVYVSLDGGQSKTHCPITPVVGATAPSVQITWQEVGSITWSTTIRVSVDGGASWKYGQAGYAAQPITAVEVAAAINRFAGSDVNAVVVGTGTTAEVRVTALSKGASVKLRVAFNNTTRAENGTDSGENLATKVTNSINTNANSLVTATLNNGAVVVVAKKSGGAIKLRVWWGPAASQAVEATGVPVALSALATAINNLANVAAVVKDNTIVVTSDAKGDNIALKVQWGDETGRTLTAAGTTQDLGTKETRVYTYTFIADDNGLVIESAPWSDTNMASATVEVYTGTGKEMCLLNGDYRDGYTKTSCEAAGGTWEASRSKVTLTGFGVPGDIGTSEDWFFTGYRIYRATAGVFLYVDKLEKPASSYADAKRAAELGEPCPSTTWMPPPSNLKGLINLPNGMMAGFAGRDVRFCVPYRPYAWPDEYVQTLDFPVVGLGRMDTTLVVLTKGAPYFMQGAAPEYVTVVKSDLEQACVSKRSIVSMGGAVLYASPDGLMMLSSGGSRILTEGIFDRADWQALNPATIYAYGHDSKYIAFHTSVLIDGVTYNGFVVDLKSQQFIRHNIVDIKAGYSDLRNDQLYLVDPSRQVMKWEGGGNLTGRWKSKKFSMPQVTGFSCAQVEAESFDGLRCALYCNGAYVKSELSSKGDALTPPVAPRIHGRSPFRLEPVQGRDWELDLTVTQEVFNVVVGQSMAELGTA